MFRSRPFDHPVPRSPGAALAPWARLTLAVALLLAALAPPSGTTRAAASPTLQLITEHDAGVAPLVAFIAAARHTLDGEIYLLTDRDVEAALDAAAVRGVTVRINLDPHPFGTARSVVRRAYAALATHGIQVRYTSPAYVFTHAKYIISDDDSAWIGTMNWSASAFRSNREFAIVDRDPTAVAQAAAIFAADWVHAPPAVQPTALVVSPLNARGTLAALIAGARRTLDVYAEEVNDPAMSADLIAAVDRGVRVRLVTTVEDAIGALATALPTVRRDRALYIHGKALIVDAGLPDARLFLGSENLSAGSLDRNRELGLVASDPAIIGPVERTFAADLAAIGGAAGGAPAAAATPSAPTAAVPSGPSGTVGVLVRLNSLLHTPM